MSLTSKQLSIILGILLIILVSASLVYFFRDRISLNLGGGSSTPTASTSAEILANPPGVNDPPSESSAYLGALLQIAKPTDRLDISSGCRMSPQSAETTMSNLLTIYNLDTVNHQIKFSGGTVSLAPGESKKIPQDFFDREGTYTYTCDGEKINGIITVT